MGGCFSPAAMWDKNDKSRQADWGANILVHTEPKRQATKQEEYVQEMYRHKQLIVMRETCSRARRFRRGHGGVRHFVRGQRSEGLRRHCRKRLGHRGFRLGLAKVTTKARAAHGDLGPIWTGNYSWGLKGHRRRCRPMRTLVVRVLVEQVNFRHINK